VRSPQPASPKPAAPTLARLVVPLSFFSPPANLPPSTTYGPFSASPPFSGKTCVSGRALLYLPPNIDSDRSLSYRPERPRIPHAHGRTLTSGSGRLWIRTSWNGPVSFGDRARAFIERCFAPPRGSRSPYASFIGFSAPPANSCYMSSFCPAHPPLVNFSLSLVFDLAKNRQFSPAFRFRVLFTHRLCLAFSVPPPLFRS